MSVKLVIGDFGKSSWSFRAWLVLVSADVSFQTLQIRLEQPDTHQSILEHSPSGKVPALLVDDIVINDSLAICEYVAETHPHAQLWPEDARLRAQARAAAHRRRALIATRGLHVKSSASNVRDGQCHQPALRFLACPRATEMSVTRAPTNGVKRRK